MKPSHEPTEEDRKLVVKHATVGTRQEVISEMLDIDPKTLRKYYRAELDFSTANANADIGGALYNKAMDGDTAAMIFWMKTKGRWSEKSELDITSNGETIGKIERVIIDPKSEDE